MEFKIELHTKNERFADGIIYYKDKKKVCYAECNYCETGRKWVIDVPLLYKGDTGIRLLPLLANSFYSLISTNRIKETVSFIIDENIVVQNSEFYELNKILKKMVLQNK